MSGSFPWLPLWLAAVNLSAFVLFGADKHRAKTDKWRIRESTLFLTALLGGSAGAALGMFVFRHKTRRSSFAIGIPAILICQLLAAWLLLR